MYAPFFGLQQEAFSIAPDPRFLHLSGMHREALAHLLFGLQGGGGFVLLTGDIGTGKTTVCRCFLDQIPPGHQVAYIFNPKLTPLELMQTVCDEFGISLPAPPPSSLKPCIDALNQHLLTGHAAGQHCVLIVDEAQALSAELLEMLRLLTNLETQERKLLQIVLVGQPELRDLLARPELEQLAQRVIARVHLGPLRRDETAEYVRHRLGVAGWAGESPFSPRALQLVHRASGGVPRRINLLCQRALLGAYALGTKQLSVRIVQQAAAEVFAHSQRPSQRWAWPAAAMLVVTCVGLAAWWGWTGPSPVAQPATRAVAAAAVASSPALTQQLLGHRSDTEAWSALAALWGLEPEALAAPCQSTKASGVGCHEGLADLAMLRRLQRPVLLHLHGTGPVVLLALGPEHAQVSGASGAQRVALQTLQAAWTGRFSTLWRTPPGWGAAGGAEAAQWVLQRLAAHQGELAAGASRLGKAGLLRQRVFAFQVSQGLPLDGLAGPLTLMQINRVSGVDEPQLQQEP